MPSEIHLDAARELARAEQECVRGKLDAYDQFVSRVQDLPLGSSHSGQRASVLSAGGTHSSGSAASTKTGCASVRAAFRDTIRPYSVADFEEDEPLLETIRAELSDSIAVALAPTTDTGFTSSLQDAIITAVESRQVEAHAMQAGVDAECDELAAASETVESILEWLRETDKTPLTELGFDELRARHETLTAHRERCTQLLADRQAFLDQSATYAGQTGMRHRRLVRYLYDDLPVVFPVLSAGVSVETLCADSQRAVREHLTRRV